MAFGVFAALASLVVIALVLLLPSIRSEKSSGFAQIPAVLRQPKVQVGLVAVILIFTG
jgi:predicted MFS family arabinose efflux permease